MSIVADRIKRIKLSPSVAARAIIAELREQGRRIIDLTIGEPDFSTPEHIRQAATAAMNCPCTSSRRACSTRRSSAVMGRPGLPRSL